MVVQGGCWGVIVVISVQLRRQISIARSSCWVWYSQALTQFGCEVPVNWAKSFPPHGLPRPAWYADLIVIRVDEEGGLDPGASLHRGAYGRRGCDEYGVMRGTVRPLAQLVKLIEVCMNS